MIQNNHFSLNKKINKKWVPIIFYWSKSNWTNITIKKTKAVETTGTQKRADAQTS